MGNGGSSPFCVPPPKFALQVLPAPLISMLEKDSLTKSNCLSLDTVEKAQSNTLSQVQSKLTSLDDDDFPDGGLRAWMVVFGVRALLHS